MRTTLAAVLIGTIATAAGCKSDQEKQAETAAAELAQARAKAAEAQAQLAAAEKKVEQSAEQLGKQGEALGAQGAALGAQGAALGAQAAATGMQAAAIAMENLAKSMGKPGATGPLVDFRDLKALLPETIGDAETDQRRGRKVGRDGFWRQQGDGQIQGRRRRPGAHQADRHRRRRRHGRRRVRSGRPGGRQGDRGRLRAHQHLGGRKVFEKYNSQSKRGEIKALVGNRFVVEVDGDDVPMETIKDALSSKLDLAKLEALAPPGARDRQEVRRVTRAPSRMPIGRQTATPVRGRLRSAPSRRSTLVTSSRSLATFLGWPVWPCSQRRRLRRAAPRPISRRRAVPARAAAAAAAPVDAAAAAARAALEDRPRLRRPGAAAAPGAARPAAATGGSGGAGTTGGAGGSGGSGGTAGTGGGGGTAGRRLAGAAVPRATPAARPQVVPVAAARAAPA